MTTVFTTILIITVLVQMVAYIKDGKKISELEGDLKSAKHVKSMFRESLTKVELKNVELSQENLDLMGMLESAHVLLEHTRVSLTDGVFYDKKNDTIVVIDSLEKIGDL
jgi:hypothetical protein